MENSCLYRLFDSEVEELISENMPRFSNIMLTEEEAKRFIFIDDVITNT